MTSESPARAADEEPELALSLVRGDVLFRMQRRIGLVPAGGLGIGRRALFFALLTWAPIAVWAGLAHRALPGSVAEPLLQHFGVHVRCLVAIPLFIVAEGVAHALTTRLVPFLASSGLVRDSDRPRLRELLRGAARLRDSTLPWATVATLVAAWTLLAPNPAGLHEVVWADEGGPRPSPGFGGFWFLYVARPIYAALLLGWVWRLGLLLVLFSKIARLGLEIVPTHPDGAGGLGFLEQLCFGWSPVVFGISSVLASRWAHEVVYHDVAVQTLRLPMVAFGLLALVVFLSPLVVFMPLLGAAKRAALLEYSALVGQHGRLVRRRWILREPVGDPEILAAPELGPVADTAALYDSVQKMRTLPIGRQALAAIVLPAALPMLGVVAIEVPVRELLLKVLSTLA